MSTATACAIKQEGGYDLHDVLEAERELMNRFSKDYRASSFANSYFYRQERQRYIDWILQTLRQAGEDPATLAFFNPGSSVGDLLEPLARTGVNQLTGLDMAEKMLAECRRRVPSARLIQSTIEGYAAEPASFDVVLTSFTLHHMFDPRAFFVLVDRCLKPGGWFFILDYNARAWENARWSKPVVHGLVAPLRRLIKWKNRRALAREPHIQFACNPAHRLLSYREILEAMSSPERYTVTRRTRGVFLPAFNYALFEESPVDRVLYRVLDRVDRIAEPFGAGNLQWIVGRRHA